MVVSLYFLFFDGFPFIFIVGTPSPERFQTVSDHGERRVRVTVGDKAIGLSLNAYYGKQSTTDNSTYSEYFTSKFYGF